MFEGEHEEIVRLRAEVRRLKLECSELRRLNGKLAGVVASGEALRDRMHLTAILGGAYGSAAVK